jgi:hypothetical protein
MINEQGHTHTTQPFNLEKIVPIARIGVEPQLTLASTIPAKPLAAPVKPRVWPGE